MRSVTRVAAAVAAVVVGVGCGGGGDTSNDSDSSAGVYPPPGVEIQTTTPAGTGPVDQVTWNLPYGEPTSLDPLKAWDLPSNTVLSNLCDSLLRIDPDLKIVPGLATKVSQPDGSTVVLDVREDVSFWDGTPMTMDDVMYSLERQANPDNGSYYSSITDYIESVKQTGPQQVTIKTNPPLQLLKGYLATGIGTIVQKKYAEEKGDKLGTAGGGVMCTGPFELDKWRPGQEIVLKRNPDYWDSELQPQVGSMVFKFVTDPAAATNGLTTGELDGSYEVPVQAISRLQNSDVGTLYLGKNLTFATFVTLQKTGPFADPKVRQALSLSLDRAGIAKTVFNGLAAPLSWPVGSDAFGYAPEVWQKAYDEDLVSPTANVEKAKKVLASTTKPSRPIVIAVQSGDSAATNIALAAKSAAEQIGLGIEVKQLQPAQFINLIFSTEARKDIDSYIGSNDYMDQPDPMSTILFNAYSKSPFNRLDYSNAKVDSLITKAEATIDDAERARLGAEAMQIWNRSLGKVPVIQYPQRMFMSNKITGAPPDQSTYLYYPWAARIGAAE